MGNIRNMMTSDVETCSLLDNIFEVAVKMKEWNVGVVPIVDNQKLVGVITDRDIVVRCIAEKHPASSKVEEIMSSEIIKVSPESSTNDAIQLMAKHQIRRLPVVEDDRLVGIISLGDFATSEMTDNQAKIALTEISEPGINEAHH